MNAKRILIVLSVVTFLVTVSVGTAALLLPARASPAGSAPRIVTTFFTPVR